MSPAKIIHYFDFKSPYAYLAQQATYDLAAHAEVEWRPYTLHIPSFLGAAQLDAAGRDTVGQRNPHQWRRVRYAYADCRREANKRGLVLRGPRKVFDSSLAHIAWLYARRAGDWRPFHDAVFARFWKRDLDIENPGVLAELLELHGVAAAEFPAFLAGEGRKELTEIQEDAEQRGVFGVPSYIVAGELFWGGERIPDVRALSEGQL